MDWIAFALIPIGFIAWIALLTIIVFVIGVITVEVESYIATLKMKAKDREWSKK